MKKHLLALVTLSAMSGNLLANCSTSISTSDDNEATGRTTLANTQVDWTSQALHQLVSAIRSDFNHAREDGKGAAFQIALFGGKTTNNNDMARYFFPDSKESLVSVEQGPITGQPGFSIPNDLLAQNFNIYTVDKNYNGTISISPQQSTVGLGLYYRQSFWKNPTKGRGVWLSLSAPITHIKNNMRLTEIIESTSDADTALNPNAVNNMTAALNQPDWNFGKISPCAMKKTGLGDIEFKLGYEWLQHEPAHMESYIGVIIPTGNKQNAKYVFEPIVGRGKHPGIMWGSSLGLDIWENEAGDKMLRFELANHSEYLFNKTQIRSFDLKNKPWSRYINVYLNQEQAEEAFNTGDQTLATPGINVFTQEVKVTPGLIHDINTAFVFSCRRFEGEIGYNFLAKRAEHVKLNCPWQEGPALKHFNGVGETNPINTIQGNPFLEQVVQNNDLTDLLIPVPVTSYETSLIKATDLNLQSAATPCLLSNTLYLALGYRNDEREYPILSSIAGSFTFSKNNDAVMRRWVVWGKVGVAF